MLTRRRRTYILLIETVLILLVALIGHMTGREMGRRHLMQRDQTIQQLREERQEISGELNKRSDRVSELQTKLKEVQATLDEIVPSENIYLIRPNQSLIVVGGRIIVGLIGSPSNQAVTVNVNGKQYTAAAGDVIKVAYNDTTPCQVVVQSFDMFKAILHATCSVTAR